MQCKLTLLIITILLHIFLFVSFNYSNLVLLMELKVFVECCIFMAYYDIN